MKKIVISTLFVLSIAACSSTIGNKSDPVKAAFQIGATTKSQVAEVLGLPAAVNYSPDGMQEAWAYQKSTNLKKIYFVTPSGLANSNPFYDVTVFFKEGNLPENTAIVYIFNHAGLLSEVQRP